MAAYTAQSRRHVFLHGHAANSVHRPGKSRFFPTEGGQAFSDEVLAVAGAPIVQSNGRLRYEAPDLGRAVGYDRHGSPTRGGIVVVEGPHPAFYSTFVPDEVVTQHPW
jgi:hypothetical protein